MSKSPTLGINWSEKRVKTADLVPYERNPRTITKGQFEKLVESLKQNGYHQRIIAQPDLRVIGGHQRIRALETLGIHEVTVLIPDRELTHDEFRRILVQDNLAFGEFDFDILSADFDREELQDWGMSDAMLGNVGEMSEQGLTDADDAPPAQETTVAKEGDIWVLGDHRVGCGDSTNAEFVGRVLEGTNPSLMVTDPPYGVEYDPSWRQKAGVGSAGAAEGKVLNDDRADWREAWVLFPGHIAYVWHGGLHAPTVAQSLEKSNFKVRAQIVWVKTRPALSRGHYHWQHEPALYAQKPETDDNWRFGEDHEIGAYAVKGGGAQWRGGRKQSTVWHIDHLKNDTGHGTQKPVMCMQRPMENHTAKGDWVYDPFLGSGTTVIAAQRTGRHCAGLELSPQYVDVIIRRWQAFTGRAAVLLETGETFASLESKDAPKV